MDKKEKPMSIMDRWAESEDDIVVVRRADENDKPKDDKKKLVKPYKR